MFHQLKRKKKTGEFITPERNGDNIGLPPPAACEYKNNCQTKYSGFIIGSKTGSKIKEKTVFYKIGIAVSILLICLSFQYFYVKCNQMTNLEKEKRKKTEDERRQKEEEVSRQNEEDRKEQKSENKTPTGERELETKQNSSNFNTGMKVNTFVLGTGLVLTFAYALINEYFKIKSKNSEGNEALEQVSYVTKDAEKSADEKVLDTGDILEDTQNADKESLELQDMNVKKSKTK